MFDAPAERPPIPAVVADMTRDLMPAGLILALHLPSCGPAPDVVQNLTEIPQREKRAMNGAAEVQPSEPTVANEGDVRNASDLSPPELSPEAESSVRGARNILLSFARAIELGEYGQARSLLSTTDQQRWNDAEFAAVFANLSEVTVAVPGGTIADISGSARYTAPVTVTGQNANGRPVRIEGVARLRRVDDPADPRRLWQFESLTLDWTH